MTAQRHQSLIDGLACLQAVIVRGDGIGSRELGRQLDIESTRANRLLKSLAEVEMVRQDAAAKYHPGPGIHVLAAQSLHSSDLVRRAAPALESLLRTDLTVSYGLLWRTEVCYLIHSTGGESLWDGLGREGSFPAELSGLGIALLARRTDEDVRVLYQKPPISAEAVVPDPPVGLLAKLARTRRAGYALSGDDPDKERTVAVAVGAPAISAIGLAGRFSDTRIPQLVEALRTCATTIDANNATA